MRAGLSSLRYDIKEKCSEAGKKIWQGVKKHKGKITISAVSSALAVTGGHLAFDAYHTKHIDKNEAFKTGFWMATLSAFALGTVAGYIFAPKAQNSAPLTPPVAPRETTESPV